MIKRLILATVALLTATVLGATAAQAQMEIMPTAEGTDWFHVIVKVLESGSGRVLEASELALPADNGFEALEFGPELDVVICVATTTAPSGQTELLREMMSQVVPPPPSRILTDTRDDRTFMVGVTDLGEDYEVLVTFNDVQFYIGATPMREFMVKIGQYWVNLIQNKEASYFARNGHYTDFKMLSTDPKHMYLDYRFQADEREVFLPDCGFRITLPEITYDNCTIIVRCDRYGFTVTGDMTGDITVTLDEEIAEGEG